MVCQDAPEDVGTYKAKATAEGGVTYTDAEKTITLTINEASAGTAVAPTISDVTENGSPTPRWLARNTA